MRPTRLPALLRPALAAALALAACTSGTTPTTAPDAATVSTCSSDAECSTGFKCDRDSRQCVCTGDEACPTGQFCNAFTGLCVTSVPGCTSDAACPQGQYCDRALRSCKAVTAICGKCKADAECGANSRCAANPDFPAAGVFCSPLCVAQDGGVAGCPAGLKCASDGKTCVPQQGACGVTNSCVPDTLGVCKKDSDCTDPSQQCDTSPSDPRLWACVAKNRTCPAGDACDPQQRVCAHGCATDADCTLIEGGIGYTCRNNACYKRASCNSDADCSAVLKQICAANPDGSKSCKPGCVSPTDCPLGQGCNNDPSHPRCTPSCKQNSDCPLNTVCQAGACASSFGGCPQACQATPACAIGSSCSSSGCCVAGDLASLCPHGCAATGPTPQANCYLVPAKTCNNQNECDTAYPGGGTLCKLWSDTTRCVGTLLFKGCTSDADCPYKGFHCQTLTNGGPLLCLPIEDPAVAACYLGHP